MDCQQLQSSCCQGRKPIKAYQEVFADKVAAKKVEVMTKPCRSCNGSSLREQTEQQREIERERERERENRERARTRGGRLRSALVQMKSFLLSVAKATSTEDPLFGMAYSKQ